MFLQKIPFLLKELEKLQEKNGEFKTFAEKQDGEQFYIGKSPFNTAHILNLISDIQFNESKVIQKKGINFLKQLDTHNLKLYKFWYSDSLGTAYKKLPFDMDDTAVVNQALFLNNETTINKEIIENNVNKDHQIYTWWKPKAKTIFYKLSILKLLPRHYLGYAIFLKNKEGLKMADRFDTEAIVRINVYTFLSLLNKKYKINENFPIQIKDVSLEIENSLHYMNISMYYLVLCRLQSINPILNKIEEDKLKIELKQIITQEKEKNGLSANFIALLLALSFLNLNEAKRYNDEINLFINQQKWDNEKYYICVGNKKFDNYHQYFSPAFTLALLIRLIYNIETND